MPYKSRRIVSAVTTTGERAIKSNHQRWMIIGGIVAIISLITVGVLAGRGVIGSKNQQTASSSTIAKTLNPLSSVPSPNPTPQLAREYVYSGSRLLATEDANAPHSSNQPSDLVVWRLTGGTGYWYVRDSSLPPTNPEYTTNVFGGSGDKATPADFDGDGLYDFCVYRPSNGTWYIQPNNGGTSFYGVQFGLSSDKPVPADYDGDGRADVAVWRDISSGNPAIPPSFFILNSSTNTVSIVSIGQTGDKAVPADYDGDGRADVAVWREALNNSTWIIKQSSQNGAIRNATYGTTGDIPVAGDFDGDGRFDPAVVRINSDQWFYQKSSQSNASTAISLAMDAGDEPVAGDYAQSGSTSTDGITDAAVWRPSNGTWYIRLSQNGNLRQEQWGMNGDTPVPAPFRR